MQSHQRRSRPYRCSIEGKVQAVEVVAEPTAVAEDLCMDKPENRRPSRNLHRRPILNPLVGGGFGPILNPKRAAALAERVALMATGIAGRSQHNQSQGHSPQTLSRAHRRCT